MGGSDMLKIRDAVAMLVEVGRKDKRRNLQMSGDPHYQPKDLRPYLGYDQRVSWYILVEFFWMLALAKLRIMPRAQARLLTPRLLRTLLAKITTTQVTKLERRKTKHDILALLACMRQHMPHALHRWLHWGLTSYDVICTAYALQLRYTFFDIFFPKMQEVDKMWRGHIAATRATRQIGRTHLQNALPITVGAWLAVLHSRFVETGKIASIFAGFVTGKFSGAVGTSAACRAFLGKKRDVAGTALQLLGLLPAKPSTQITTPEDTQRFYHEIRLLSAVLAALGDDVRHLQASAIAEVISASSTSSTMSHKTGNPIAAENMDGMHASVLGEFLKLMLSTNSTLQRVLTGSSVMRGYGANLVFTYQQLLTAERIFKGFQVNELQCLKNFQDAGTLVMAELLHLSLQANGCPRAHSFVNKRVVPEAKKHRISLRSATERVVARSRDTRLIAAWRATHARVLHLLDHPQEYIGDAISMAEKECGNVLVA